jgi:choline kinase
LIVVDFEYASPNPAAYDIANHFHEWTADYHCSVPHVLDPSLYPTYGERRNFYLAYLEHSSPQLNESARELEIQKLDREVCVWSPASHAMWAIWGIVQAREDLEGEVEVPEFDYIGYAKCRLEAFRRGLEELRV